MGTNSARYGFYLPSASEGYKRINDINNWNLQDGFAGEYVCTSTTRPSVWGSPQAGLCIYETDTGLKWRWNGVGFVRSGGSGLLQMGQRTVDISVTGTTPVPVVTVTATVPQGGRTVEVKAGYPSIDNTNGATALFLYRGATQLTTWQVAGTTGASSGQFSSRGGTMVFPDVPPSGSTTYSLQAAATAAWGGTSYVHASSGAPVNLEIVEV